MNRFIDVAGNYENVRRLVRLGALLLGSVLIAAPALAQDNRFGNDDLSTVIEQAKRDGVRVVIVDPGSPAPPKKASSPPLLFQAQELAANIKKELSATLSAIPDYASLSLQALQKGGGDRSVFWPFLALAVGAGLLLIGWGPAHLYAGWASKQFAIVYSRPTQLITSRISFLYLRAFSELLESVIQVGVAFLIALALAFEPWAYRFTIYLVLYGWLTYRISDLFFSNLFAVSTPKQRVLPLRDAESARLYRGASRVFVPMIIVMVGCAWQENLGMDHHAHLLTLIAATAVSAALLAHFVIANRKVIAGLIVGSRGNQEPISRRLFASSWHLIALLYIAVAYAVLFARLVLGLPNAMFLTVAPLIAICAAIAIFGAGLWLVEWIYQARRPASNAPIEQPSHASAFESERSAAPSLIGETDEFERRASATNQTIASLPSYKVLFVKWAGLFAVMASVAWLFDVWGVSFTSSEPTTAAIWKISLIGFFGYLAWGVIRVAFDRKIAEEGGDIEFVPGEEGGGAGSRLATLLPLIRNFVLILLAAIVAMMVLVEMGVNIAPIFAGAGIVGLAIGFGAQTLVKDVISGVFFLIDDAFRKGEYIDIGSVKGTVEKISIRSMQLRHHNGPLNTVPFGDIGHITNFSRDWVVMKFSLRLTYDTDAEVARKLIKKLGQELLDDPDVGPKFIQPLKSQGVTQMEDSAMIMRVKFMTRPGDQWGVRRIVFARIRDLFEKKGIRFASREVTVRLADESERYEGSKREAIATGATSLLHDTVEEPRATASDKR